jgi:hypothetical protein
MGVYENFSESTKCIVDGFFEISIIMKDYYENIVGVEKKQAAEQSSELGLLPSIFDMNFLACCSCD